MRFLIFLNGSPEFVPSNIVKIYRPDSIICADGGANTALQLGCIPNIVIGDMDSILDSTKNLLQQHKTKLVPYPRDKDYTDSELAVEYALSIGATELIITGYVGSRPDHMLANLFFFAKLPVETILVDTQHTYYFIKARTKIAGSQGDILSLIPLTSEVTGIRTEGLEYSLHNESLPYGSTRGVSNVFSEKNVVISVQNGTLLVIHLV